MAMGVEVQAHWNKPSPVLDADHLQPIVILGRQEAVGLGEHIHGAGDVQRLHACEHHDGDGFVHLSRNLR
jgi:hypothetical protein